MAPGSRQTRPGAADPPCRPAPQQAAAACRQKPCRQRSGIARPEDEGLTAAALLLLHGWQALSAAAAKAAPAVPWTSLSSIKVHRIQAPVGCSRRGKEGAEPPYLGRVQAPGAVCAMPHAPPKKTTLGTRSQRSPCSLPWLGLQRGKTNFLPISGAARRAAAPLQPGWARTRRKPGGDGEAGVAQRRHVLLLAAFRPRSNSPALVQAGAQTCSSLSGSTQRWRRGLWKRSGGGVPPGMPIGAAGGYFCAVSLHKLCFPATGNGTVPPSPNKNSSPPPAPIILGRLRVAVQI